MARAPAKPIGRRRGGRFGVIDIGSNSIRLVVFERASRAALPMFNEKVMCGLGRGLDSTKRLNRDGALSAHVNLVRFVRLAEAMDVADLTLLGTAAVRDAADGAAFAAEVKRRTGRPVAVLSGEREAELSALGVLSGIPGADGLMGDLGGGSLELVELDAGRTGRQVTLPLGPLRLMERGGVGRARKIVEEQLATVEWLASLRGRSFYPVGGAWRTLARIHMGHTDYPLHVIHQYSVERHKAEDIYSVVAQQGDRSLAKMAGISRRRLDILPFAALVLEQLLHKTEPDHVVFSAYGLREGYLYSRLAPAEQAKDPLIAACTDIARTHSRFGPMGERLQRWLDPLFAKDTPEQRRLRLAACLLSDIGWREHPDYRAQHAAMTVLHLPLTGLGHAERVSLALTMAARYGGPEGDALQSVKRLLQAEEERERANALGLAIRLAYSVSGATPALLERTTLSVQSGRLTLPPPPGEDHGEAVLRRLDALGRALGLPVGQPAAAIPERKAS